MTTPRPPSRNFFLFAILVALFCASIHALPILLGSPDQRMLLSAAQGIAAGNKLAGYPAAGFADKIGGWLWQTGGAGLLLTGHATFNFMLWAAASFVLLCAAAWHWRPEAAARWTTVLIAMATATLVWTCVSPTREVLSADRKTALQLTVPALEAQAAAKQTAGTVFASPSALLPLQLFAPLAAEGLTPAQSIELSANPTQWRAELRKSNWTTVVLAGPTAELKPLLDHLSTSPDWSLTSLTNQGYIFTRGGDPKPLPTFSVDAVTYPTTRETAIYLAQISERYDALRRVSEGHDAITKALDLAPSDPDVLVHAASLEAAHQRWQTSLEFCDRALQQRPGDAFALLLKAVCLLETRQPGAAEEAARQVLAKSPNDTYTLFLYARICRVTNDYAAEAEALERLIRLAKSSGAAVPQAYYVYLGQAYAKLGRPDEALNNYDLALRDKYINPDFAQEIRESIRTIQEKRPAQQ